MQNQPDLKRLWLYPGELAVLLEKNGYRLDGDSPLAAEAAFRYPEALLRSPEDLLAEVANSASREALDGYLRCLVHPGGLLKIKRGMRRQPVETFFACTGAPDGGILLLKVRQDEGVELLFPFSLETLAETLSGGMGDIQPLNLPLEGFMPLSPGGAVALLALADLFNELYPTPDPEWLPDAPLLFTLESWRRLIEGGLQANPKDSLVAAFQDLTGVSVPPLERDELASLLLVFANEGYIGVESEQALPGDLDVLYYAARELTIALRCMAWWDLSLGIEGFPQSAETGILPFYALQATAIWQFAPQADAQQISIQAIYGQKLKETVTQILRQSFGGAASRPKPRAAVSRVVLPAAAPPPAPPSRAHPAPAGKKRTSTPAPALPAAQTVIARVIRCPVCGSPVKSTARFCRSCGAAIDSTPAAPTPNSCPNCKQAIRPGAAFCKHCGQKLS